MAPVHPLYIPQNTDTQSSLTSSLSVLRTTDNALFLATVIPTTLTKDRGHDRIATPLAPCIIPTAATPISRILNHPNIISLVDIVSHTSLPGSTSMAGSHADFTVWEDMSAGSLSYLLPSLNSFPNFDDEAGWHALSSCSPTRFSLPESLCWHVLLSISKALLWLHYGVKEMEGVRGEWEKHDDDWHSILIRDVSPGQIWFKKPRATETYGECKLGGFQWAKVCGGVGASTAFAERVEGATVEKQYYWAPEVYNNISPQTRRSEIYSLGAVIYTMMTGMPPPRLYDYNWRISRMNDKGFSSWLREIVADMLKHEPGQRPDSLRLVDRVEEGWRAWRANTREGAEYVDARDAVLGDRIQRAGGRVGTSEAILGL